MQRNITRDEINRITKECSLRDKAFFTIMRQTGLPPLTLKQLRIKHVEKILEPNPPKPCKIETPLPQKHPIFMGYEAANYIQQYLNTRRTKTLESFLFTANNDPNKPINTKDMSRTFHDKAGKLKIKGVRLYSLVYFYEEKAKDYLKQIKRSKMLTDGESCRKLYEQIAMPDLESELPTQNQIQFDRLRKQLEKTNNEVSTLKDTVTQLLPLAEIIKTFDDYENLKTLVNFFRDEILDEYPDKKLRPTKVQFSPYIGIQLKKIAQTKGITEQEALKQLFANDVEAMKKADKNWTKIEKRLKLKHKKEKTLTRSLGLRSHTNRAC